MTDPVYCQGQGPTLGPTQGRVKVKIKVRTWSGHGQVKVRSGLPPTPTQKYTLNQCLESRALSKSCLYHHYGPQND